MYASSSARPSPAAFKTTVALRDRALRLAFSRLDAPLRKPALTP